MTNKLSFRFLFILPLFALLFSSCEDLFVDKDDPTPTKDLMTGVWEVTEAVDLETDSVVTSSIRVIYAGFHLSSDNTVISTAGPLTSYLVYGPNKYFEATSKIKQAFDYSNLNFNGGEFFVDKGTVDQFTLEMKLEGIAGSGTFEDLLTAFGVEINYLDEVIYHRFMDVTISLDEDNPRQMVWTFDNNTATYYFTKNQYGDNLKWQGIDIPFRKLRVTLEKRSKSLQDLVNENNQ